MISRFSVLSPLLRALRLGLVLLFQTGPLRAAESEAQALRTKFASDLAAKSLPILKQQIANLTALERKASDATDYAAAIAASEERKKLLAIIAELEKVSLLASGTLSSAAPDKPINLILKPADAATSLSGVRFDSATGVLTDWKKDGSATWKLPTLPPGGYEVILTYESGALEGGSVIVQEKFFTLTANLQTTLSGPSAHHLGVLRIRDGDGIFKITARTLINGSLMRLHSVQLQPTGRSSND